jgi:hypothetical protein
MAFQPGASWQSGNPAPAFQEPEPTPMMGMGRFEVPKLPENPTQVEVGENLYFYHCMPCHGDYGQGLTDEFREAWVEDHQNCWARGCHTGRPEDEGFPIPKYVPSVIASQLLVHFPTAQALYDFLSNEHPPQNPGILREDEYWALTAFLWFENGQLPSDVVLGSEKTDLASPEVVLRSEREIETKALEHTQPTSEHRSGLAISSIGGFLIGSVLLIGLILLARKKIYDRK